MHEPEPERGSQSFDRVRRKFGLSLTKPVEKLNIDPDQAGQLRIRDSCQCDRASQIAKHTRPHCCRANPAYTSHCLATPRIFRSHLLPPQLPLHVGFP